MHLKRAPQRAICDLSELTNDSQLAGACKHLHIRYFCGGTQLCRGYVRYPSAILADGDQGHVNFHKTWLDSVGRSLLLEGHIRLATLSSGLLLSGARSMRNQSQDDIFGVPSRQAELCIRQRVSKVGFYELGAVEWRNPQSVFGKRLRYVICSCPATNSGASLAEVTRARAFSTRLSSSATTTEPSSKTTIRRSSRCCASMQMARDSNLIYSTRQ